MGRLKGSLNKIHSAILYPRKCNWCEYVSNNPAMWYYHNKTHNTIPDGQLCEHGCGGNATIINTRGKYTCLKVAQQCPAYIETQSIRVKAQWASPNLADRKIATGKSLRERLHNQETLDKAKATKSKKSGLLTPELAKNFRHYARAIRERAQKWATDQGHTLGKYTVHVDHKFSILDAWKANLPIEVVNHPVNLQLLSAKENSSKGSKSSITLAQLYEMIMASALPVLSNGVLIGA